MRLITHSVASLVIDLLISSRRLCASNPPFGSLQGTCTVSQRSHLSPQFQRSPKNFTKSSTRIASLKLPEKYVSEVLAGRELEHQKLANIRHPLTRCQVARLTV